MASADSPSVPFALVIALTASVLAVSCARVLPARDTAPAAPANLTEALNSSDSDAVPTTAHGMWVWSSRTRLADPVGTMTLMDTCRRAGLNEVYLSVNGGVLDDPRLAELVGALRSAGVRVEALMGDAVWYQPERRAPMVALIEAVAAYNRRHPGTRIAGIHLDIEPHQILENRGKHAFLPALAETVSEAAALARKHGMPTSVDLPRFALEEQGPAFARTGARPFVMLYQLRDRSPAWLVKQSGSVIDHTYTGTDAALESRLVVGLRIEDYPEDLETMLGALEVAHGARARYGGWAIHDEAKYRARFAH